MALAALLTAVVKDFAVQVFRIPSADSRSHGTDPGDGPIPESAVIGRVFLVIWPAAQLKEVPIPATFTRHQLGAAAVPQVPPAAGAHLPPAPGAHLAAAARAHLPLARR